MAAGETDVTAREIAIDLFCGLGGWTEGLLAEGFDVIGFDSERHEYGEHRYPAQLVLQDVRTLDGRQFKDARLIVASPPCQEYSYMAMPWRRAKQIARALRGYGPFPDDYKGSRTVEELNALFDVCFRIQREASEAAGRHIPLVVENVQGAQPWVGRARWNYGSYYLWGDVPALMPMTRRPDGMKVPSQDGGCRTDPGNGARFTSREGGVKVGGLDWSSDDKAKRGCFRDSAIKNNDSLLQSLIGSPKRKASSAMIAKIPFELARHIAGVHA